MQYWPNDEETPKKPRDKGSESDVVVDLAKPLGRSQPMITLLARFFKTADSAQDQTMANYGA